MSDPIGGDSDSDVLPGPDEEIDDTPTVSCQRCGREWDLAYELDELRAGNQAIEQFALDHMRHTGHFPDDVSPWRADCRQCPEDGAWLSATAANRWAETHARHTRHDVDLHHATLDEPTQVRGERGD